MHSGYKKIHGARVPIFTPATPSEPQERLTLPEDHTCHGCPLIDLNNVKPFCFLPGCLRKEFENNE